jgi:hypothetical protein
MGRKKAALEAADEIFSFDYEEDEKNTLRYGNSCSILI